MTAPTPPSGQDLLRDSRDFSLVLGGPLFQFLLIRWYFRMFIWTTLAERYVREFDAKWLRGGAAADERLVGSGDIQSLADLGNSFEVVRTMRMAPVTKEAVFQLAAASLAPVVPLALTMMSLEELLKTLLETLF